MSVDYGPITQAGSGASIPPSNWSDASKAVVWQPGGSTARNVFATLAGAESAVQQVRGPKCVSIDNSITANPVIDSDFDFGSGERGVFVGNCSAISGGFSVPVTIADGIEISNCKGFHEGLAITYQNDASALSPIRDLVDGQIFSIDQNVSVVRAGGGTGRIFDLTNLNGGGFGIIQNGLICVLGTAGAGNPAIFAPSGSNLIYIATERSELSQDAVEAPAGSTVTYQRSSTSALIDERQSLLGVTPTRTELALLEGQDFQLVTSAGEQTTTTQDPSFQVAATLVTPADLYGTYLAEWNAALGIANATIEARVQLYNLTDAAVVGGTRIMRVNNTAARMTESGRGTITLAGTAKTLQLRWNTSNSSFAAAIRDMVITLKRVS